MDSCKVIAEMTVLLLQIVYGAEVKRIFAMERRANLQVVAVSVDDVEENRKRFAETASNAATAAVELADALRARAGETGVKLSFCKPSFLPSSVPLVPLVHLVHLVPLVPLVP